MWLTLLAVAGCSGCRKRATDCPPRTDGVTIALTSLPNTLDWNASHEQSAQNYPALLAMMRGLTELDSHNQVQPGLAASWDVALTASLQQVYTFHLQPGLVWSDGKTPLRAQDFVFAWARAKQGAEGGELADVESTRAVDDLTFEVTLKGARGYFLSRLANVYPYFPAPSAELEGRPEAEVQRYFNEPQNGRPLVLGAFRVARWDRVAQRVELEANPHFANKPERGQVARLTLLQAELSPLMYEQCAVDFLFMDDPVALHRPPNDLASSRLLSTFWLGFNTTKVPLKQRNAIAHAIDRKALLEPLRGLMPDLRLADGFLPPEMPGYAKGNYPTFDPALAKTIEPAELTVLVRTTGSFLPEAVIAEGLRRQLLPYGVKLKLITTSNFSNDIKASDGTLRYDLFLKRTGADYAHPNTLLTPFQHAGNHYTDWHKLDGGASVTEFERLLAEGAAATDPQKQAQAYVAAQELLLTREVAAVPLFYPTRYFRKRGWIEGLAVDPFNFLTFRQMRLKP